MSLGMIAGDGYITIYINSKPYQINSDDERYAKVVKLLSNKQGWPEDKVVKELVKVLDTIAGLKKKLEKLPVKLEFTGDAILNNGVPLHGVVVDRILEFASAGLPFDPLMKFLERMMANPSSESREELYDFLVHRHLPITPDGMVLAYKAVRGDFYDKHSGTIKNEVGSVIEISRDKVDPDRRNECSYGLHVGAIEYVRNFATSSEDKILLVEFDPADAVAVPKDHNFTKLRVARYRVVKVLDRDEVLDKPLYKTEPTNAVPYNDDYEDNWDDEYDYDDEDEDDVDIDDVVVTPTPNCGCAKCADDQPVVANYVGKKPSGQSYWNKRDAYGRFTKK